MVDLQTLIITQLIGLNLSLDLQLWTLSFRTSTMDFSLVYMKTHGSHGWLMKHNLWSMINEAWPMKPDYEARHMKHVIWSLKSEACWPMKYCWNMKPADLWSLLIADICMKYGAWPMELDLWSLPYGAWPMKPDQWSLNYGAWFLVPDLWSLTYGDLELDLWSLFMQLAYGACLWSLLAEFAYEACLWS